MSHSQHAVARSVPFVSIGRDSRNEVFTSRGGTATPDYEGEELARKMSPQEKLVEKASVEREYAMEDAKDEDA